MSKKGLLKQTNLYLLTTVTIVIVLIVAVISYRAFSEAKLRAKEMADLKARKVAADVRSFLDKVMEMNKTMALTLQTLQKGGNLTRENVAPILKDLLDSDPALYATWTMWEPDSFDAKDALYAAVNHQEYGRFACSFYRKGDSLLAQNFGTDDNPVFLSSDLLYEYDAEYYKLVKRLKTEVITSPYRYSFKVDSDSTVYMTSLVAPIIIDGHFRGVVGTDIKMRSLQKLVQQSVIYQSGFASIISGNQLIVAHPEEKYLNLAIDTLLGNQTKQVINAVQRDASYIYQTRSIKMNRIVMRYFYPIKISDVQSPWMIMVEIPLREVYDGVGRMMKQVLLVGVVGLMLIYLMIYLVAREITRPILQSVRLAGNISVGKLQEPEDILSSIAEIAELKNGFDSLIEKIKMMQHTAAMGYWELDLVTLKMQWSDNFFQLLGYKPQKLEPDVFFLLDHVAEADRSVLKSMLLSNSHHGEYPDHRFGWIGKDEQMGNALMRYRTVYNSKGEAIRKVGVVVDITHITRNEQALIDSEEKFRSVFECSNDAILIVDKYGGFMDANSVAFERSGLSREQLFSRSYYDWITEDKKIKGDEFKQAILDGQDARFETSYINADGKRIFLEINGRKMLYKGEQCFVLVSRDIGERKEAEKKIIQAIIQTEEKERGHLARELHDGVSPILSAIKLYANAINDSDVEAFRQNITERLANAVDEAVQSISDIANNLTPHVLENFGLKTAIEIFIKHIRTTSSIDFKNEIYLDRRLNRNIEITLYRIVTELINNTIKYARATTVSLTIKQNSSIVLQYIDDGCGFNMEEEDNRKGMGMFNLTNRVNSLDGTMVVKSAEGKGLIVKVEIPISA